MDYVLKEYLGYTRVNTYIIMAPFTWFFLL